MKIIFTIGIILIFFVSLMAVSKTDITINNAIYVDDDNTGGPWDGSIEHPYRLIQDALDASSDGDSIYVWAGRYYEQVMIDISVQLIGENKETTFINGMELGDVVHITADNVTISGFTIGHSGSDDNWWDPDAGIDIRSSYNTISDTIVQWNSHGMFVRASNNFIKDNSVINNTIHGVYIHGCAKSYVENNDILHNHKTSIQGNGVGVLIYNAQECIISRNNIQHNYYGILEQDSTDCNIAENIIISNIAAITLGDDCNYSISRNTMDGRLNLHNSSAYFYQNNFYNPYDIWMWGGKVYWEDKYGAVSISRSYNTWENNYWDGFHPLIKFIKLFNKTHYSFYLDVDWRPALQSFDIGGSV